MAKLKVMCARSMHVAVGALGEAFAKAGGHEVTFDFGTVGALQAKLDAGEIADVVILAVPGIADALRAATAPVVGVSPLIGGAPVRGHADACLAAIGVDSTATEGGLLGVAAAPAVGVPHSGQNLGGGEARSMEHPEHLGGAGGGTFVPHDPQNFIPPTSAPQSVHVC